MAKNSQEVPDDAEVVRTYKDYGAIFVLPFFLGLYNLLIVIGRAGIGKSDSFKKEIARQDAISYYMAGKASPCASYIQGYRNRNRLIVMDDGEILWGDPNGRKFVRQLAETNKTKLIQWESTAKQLDKPYDGGPPVPRHYTTSSPLAIICNRFAFGSAHEYDAIVDRGHLVYFDPLPVEVHRWVGTWFWDQDVYDYIGTRLHLMHKLSGRTYTTAWERKRARRDWKKMIEERFCHRNKTLLVQQLENDKTFDAPVKRVEEFIRLGGGCKATYYNIRRQLEADRQLKIEELPVPPHRVRGTPPPQIDVANEVANAQLENQQQPEDEDEEEEREEE